MKVCRLKGLKVKRRDAGEGQGRRKNATCTSVAGGDARLSVKEHSKR